MEYGICKICGGDFKIYLRGGSRSKCHRCVRIESDENSKKKLVEYLSPSSTRQYDIDQALELLTKLGYDVQGDVHSQWLERCRSRGIIF